MSDTQELIREYPFVVTPQPDGSGWSIAFPDLPGVSGFASQWEDIGPEARAVSQMWIQDRIEDNMPVPEPSTDWDPIDRHDRFVTSKLLNVREMAEALSVSVRRVNQVAGDRDIGLVVSGVRLFNRDDVERMRPKSVGRPKTTASAAR